MTQLPRDRRDDEGAVLVIVLLFLGVIGLLAVAITDQVRASVGNTLIVRGQQKLVAAADGGIRHAVQAVRADSTACLSAGATSLPSPPAIDGKTVTLTCQEVAGSPSGIFGYAIVTTDAAAPSLVTSGGGTKTVTGPVFSARLDNAISNLVVKNGNLFEKPGGTSCASDSDKPAGVTIQPSGLYGYHCSGSTPLPTDDLPTSVISAAGTPNTTDATCTIFTPNRKYTGAINLTKPTYFVSGTYYFENATISLSNGASVVGGALGPESNILGLVPCANDGAFPSATGTGVKWLLGGTSSISIASNGAHMELHSRRGGAATDDGTDGITLAQIPAGAPGGWLSSTFLPSSNIFDESSGSNPDVSVHGIVDFRTGGVNLDNVSNSSNAQFLGGLAAGRLTLQNSGSSAGLAVSIDTSDQPRTLRLVSRASSGVSGDKDVVATAVIRLNNDPARSVTTLSWRSTS